MNPGRLSMTARGVASRRAAHQLLDFPLILEDPVAVPILGPEFHCDPVRHADPRARAFRALMVARSRYAEDNLATAVAAGLAQYVILGAGLDTFAHRNPDPTLQVFEVDVPSMQSWKRERLQAARIPEPTNVTYVPLDLEHKTLAASLAESGFDSTRPAFFTWLGVIPYLTRPAFRTTLQLIASLPSGSGVTFDYSLALDEISSSLRSAAKSLAARVAAAGEPFQLYFRSTEMDAELAAAGFHRWQQLNNPELNARYFTQREDGLALPPEGLAKLSTAWV